MQSWPPCRPEVPAKACFGSFWGILRKSPSWLELHAPGRCLRVGVPRQFPFLVTRGFRDKQDMTTRATVPRVSEEAPATLGLSYRTHRPAG